MADLAWQSFDPETFRAAKEADRPVLLLITEPWCHHCRELLETTFAAADVRRIIAESFVPVRVDADRRPDVNERYGMGSWPTVGYLTPDGDLIAHHGFVSAEELGHRMRKVLEQFRDHRDELERGLKSFWREKATELNNQRGGRLNRQIIDDVVNAIYEKFDHRYGGWGENAKFPHPEAIDFALIQVVKRDDPRMREVVTLTLDKMMEGAIHDPIDGAFFRFSKTPDWRSPNYEKLLDANAMRLRGYLEAFQVFENPAYRAVAEGIVRWMLEHMRDEATGAFYGNQDADPDYYQGDAAARRSRPRPRLDRTIYTNANAMTVSALLKAAVVLRRPELREHAMITLQFLVDHLYDEREGVYHYWDGTYHLPGMLADQAHLIRALIDASQHSGDADLLLPAEHIAELALKRQRAPDGGFYDILNDARQPGSMQRRNRSILENSVMAESLVRLSYLSRRREFHDEAVAALGAFSADYKKYGYYVAGYGRAVDLIFYRPLTITIVGDRDSESAQRLRDAALTTYVPSRIVQMLDPQRDPVLIGRSGLEIADHPVAHIGLGFDEKVAVDDPDALLQKIGELERQRRQSD